MVIMGSLYSLCFQKYFSYSYIIQCGVQKKLCCCCCCCNLTGSVLLRILVGLLSPDWAYKCTLSRSKQDEQDNSKFNVKIWVCLSQLTTTRRLIQKLIVWYNTNSWIRQFYWWPLSWALKSRIQLKKSRIQVPLSTNPVPGIWKSRIRIELSYMGRGNIRKIDAAFLSDGRQPEVDFLHHWAVVW